MVRLLGVHYGLKLQAGSINIISLFDSIISDIKNSVCKTTLIDNTQIEDVL